MTEMHVRITYLIITISSHRGQNKIILYTLYLSQKKRKDRSFRYVFLCGDLCVVRQLPELFLYLSTVF
jgi:hypothetical protein